MNRRLLRGIIFKSLLVSSGIWFGYNNYDLIHRCKSYVVSSIGSKEIYDPSISVIEQLIGYVK